MNHVAKIQMQFFKIAMSFEEMTLEKQRSYLQRHPQSKKTLRQHGEEIAKKLNVTFDGVWPDVNVLAFTDPQTESSFTSSANFENAEFKLHNMRKKFRDAKYKTVQADFHVYLQKKSSFEKV